MRVSPFLLVLVLVSRAPHLGAQTPPDSLTPPARDSLTSTLSGVFTEEQAAKGKDVFLGHCQSCHTNADLTSADFKADWVGKMLSDFFTFLKETMPESEPGALSNEQYAAVTAYVLQLNGLPAGAVPLATTADSLATIKFEVAPAGLVLNGRSSVIRTRNRYHVAPRATSTRGQHR